MTVKSDMKWELVSEMTVRLKTDSKYRTARRRRQRTSRFLTGASVRRTHEILMHEGTCSVVTHSEGAASCLASSAIRRRASSGAHVLKVTMYRPLDRSLGDCWPGPARCWPLQLTAAALLPALTATGARRRFMVPAINGLRHAKTAIVESRHWTKWENQQKPTC